MVARCTPEHELIDSLWKLLEETHGERGERPPRLAGILHCLQVDEPPLPCPVVMDVGADIHDGEQIVFPWVRPDVAS